MTQRTFPRGTDDARVALRVALGLAAFLAGLDKFLGLLADWPAYVAPIVAASLPIPAPSLMKIVGVVEMAVGAAVLTRWPREGAWATAAWLVLIAANLVLGGRYYDVAVRDVVMAVAAFALARLTEARAETAVVACDDVAGDRRYGSAA